MGLNRGIVVFFGTAETLFIDGRFLEKLMLNYLVLV